MTPPLTLRPNCPQEFVATNESTSTQILGVMYITLTGLIDFMVPPQFLWWALPAGPTGRLPASSQKPPTGWIPESSSYSHILGGLLNSWDGLNSKHWGFLSHQMEGSSITLKAIQERRHQASV
ncbi:hypothetical protein DSO57_1011545 [Entomophthora muscae]|uniref:Uncharacterized protein n=1 Tax=Entomophthora muscae TaxID=34485 RepID=A0ACC2U3Y8_9FUNG|nr:hypothetical protein DSO57_1011545 [Entomophthora muscae]